VIANELLETLALAGVPEETGGQEPIGNDGSLFFRGPESTDEIGSERAQKALRITRDSRKLFVVH
jgi:hypothetical protein